VRWQRVDLLDADHVRRVIRSLQPTHVFHLAGSTHVGHSWRTPADTLAANVLTTHHLLDALRRCRQPCRVLVTGSATVYAASDEPLREEAPLAPANPYAVSKLAQERLAQRGVDEDGLAVVVTRSFNHTGPGQRTDFAASGIAHQIACAERGESAPVIRVGNLDARRDLCDVRDVARAYRLLMEAGTPGTVYNVASGTARSIRSVLEGLVKRSRVPVEIEIDAALLRPSDTPVFVGDASRLRAATGWRPEVPFERTLDDLLEYWRARP
jgi:GDP-4-dehydro-6-deoxy-D-mannose reductase